MNKSKFLEISQSVFRKPQSNVLSHKQIKQKKIILKTTDNIECFPNTNKDSYGTSQTNVQVSYNTALKGHNNSSINFLQKYQDNKTEPKLTNITQSTFFLSLPSLFN